MQTALIRSPAVAARRAAATAAASRALALRRPMATAAAKAARPLSPHLTIYKFRVNMITSVFFRGASPRARTHAAPAPATAARAADNPGCRGRGPARATHGSAAR